MKFAIVKTGGKQYKVSPGQKIKVEKLNGQEGEEVVFNDVLLMADKQAKIGQPLVAGAKVIGKLLKQERADKVVVFKYKSKKRYQVKRGHHQPFSLVEVTAIK